MTDGPELRCSLQAREASLQVTGTAAAHDAFLLVEVPLPWPREITEHPALADLRVPAGTRVQGVVPSADRVADGEALVVHHQRPAGPFRRYERTERRVRLDDLVRDGLDPASGDATTQVTDLLICTHGIRDRCCGSFGMSLFLSVASRPHLRVQRTSHTGGHRFAPTAVLLPEGTVWGWLDDDVLEAVLDRSRPPADLLRHYRGSTAMPDPWTQVAEAAVLAEVGWSWLDESRSAQVVEPGVVHVESTAGEWEVRIDDRGIAPQPVCGEPTSSGGKGDPQLQVAECRQLR